MEGQFREGFGFCARFSGSHARWLQSLDSKKSSSTNKSAASPGGYIMDEIHCHD